MRMQRQGFGEETQIACDDSAGTISGHSDLISIKLVSYWATGRSSCEVGQDWHGWYLQNGW